MPTVNVNLREKASENLALAAPTFGREAGLPASENLLTAAPTFLREAGLPASENLLIAAPTFGQEAGLPASENLLIAAPTFGREAGLPASENLLIAAPTFGREAGLPASENIGIASENIAIAAPTFGREAGSEAATTAAAAMPCAGQMFGTGAVTMFQRGIAVLAVLVGFYLCGWIGAGPLFLLIGVCLHEVSSGFQMVWPWVKKLGTNLIEIIIKNIELIRPQNPMLEENQRLRAHVHQLEARLRDQDQQLEVWDHELRLVQHREQELQMRVSECQDVMAEQRRNSEEAVDAHVTTILNKKRQLQLSKHMFLFLKGPSRLDYIMLDCRVNANDPTPGLQPQTINYWSLQHGCVKGAAMMEALCNYATEAGITSSAGNVVLTRVQACITQGSKEHCSLVKVTGTGNSLELQVSLLEQELAEMLASCSPRIQQRFAEHPANLRSTVSFIPPTPVALTWA